MPASPPYREGDEVSVRVLRAMDGDSLEVRDTRMRRNIEVRLSGIDAPEIGQRYSQRSRRHLERLARGRLLLHVTGIDHYGRVLGVLRRADRPGRSVNREMIEAGWAYHYEQYAPQARALREAQQQARRARLGVWAGGDDPMRPWDYRRYRSRLREQGEWRQPPRRWRRRRRGRSNVVLPLVVVVILLYVITRLAEFLRGLPLP